VASIKSTPKVSVTVVTYNHGEWLAECLESIVTQATDFRFEVVVGDDASTDGITRSILMDYAAKYPNIIVAILRDSNVGPTANYLDVIRHTKGDYIAHIDGDDLAKPGKLQKLHDFLEKNRQCVMVGHQCNVIDRDGNYVRKFSKKRNKRIFDINYLLRNHAVFAHSSIMYRAKAKSELQYTGKNILDIYLYMCIAKFGKVGYVRDVLGVYRSGVGIASRGYADLLQHDVIQKAAMNGAKTNSIRKYQSYVAKHKAYVNYKNRDYKNYYVHSLESILLNPLSLKSLMFLIHSSLCVLFKRT